MCSCCPSRIYCCSPPWPKVNGWRISLVFSPSIVWGSSGSVLDTDGSSVRDALNHSETPHNNISIVYLFSLCFTPLSSWRKKGKSREAADLFAQDLNCWRNCPRSALVSGISWSGLSNLSRLNSKFLFFFTNLLWNFCALSKVPLAFSPHSSLLCCTHKFSELRSLPEDLIFYKLWWFVSSCWKHRNL